MARHKDINWSLPEGDNGNHTFESIHSALLMDIRDELKRLNTLLYCENFRDIPWNLDKIRLNTLRKRRKPRKATKGRKRGKSRP